MRPLTSQYSEVQGVVAGDPGGVGAGTHRHALGEHALDRRRGLGGLGTVAVDEVLALEGHAVLDRDAAAECPYPLDVARGDGLGVVEEPGQAVERNVAVDLLEHVEHPRDRFVVGGVQAERPALLHQVADHRLQLLLHGLRQVRARFEEVLEVGGGEHQHLAGAVVAEEIAALAVLDAAGPVLEVGEFFLRFLGEQVVGDAYGELALVGQFANHLVVVRVVLEAAAGVDRAGKAEAVEFAHELAGGVDLVFQRQLRSLGQGGVENHRVGPGDQHAGGFAAAVADDLAAGRVGRVLGVADHAQGGAVEQGAIVQVEDEHRGVRRGLVQFLQGRHALLGELELVPAADHPHPLGAGRAFGLVLEHAQGVGQGGHAFPAQLQVVVEATADQVQVRVVETGDHGALLQVDHLGGAAAMEHRLGVVADGKELAVLDRHGGGGGVVAVHRCGSGRCAGSGRRSWNLLGCLREKGWRRWRRAGRTTGLRRRPAPNW
ncbi:Uncharacterised protein [Pseudomonas aeruginosa]|nr:Uncharacterised protein [Pseudomonas aeruginosa]